MVRTMANLIRTLTKKNCSSDVKTLKTIIKYHKSLDEKIKKQIANPLVEKQIKPLTIPVGYKIKLGFELEFLCESEDDISLPAKVKKTLNKRKVIRGYGGNIAKTWRIHSDSSVENRLGDNNIISNLYSDSDYGNYRINALEISSAADWWDKSWINFLKIVNLMKEIEAYTNNSCGMHMSISVWKRRGTRYINVTDRITFQEIHNFTSEYEYQLLRLWKRETNNYCRVIEPKFKLLNKKLMKYQINDTVFSQHSVSDAGLDQKYQTYNLFKLTTASPYIECRIPGGSYCHTRALDAYYTMSLFGQHLVNNIAKSYK